MLIPQNVLIPLHISPARYGEGVRVAIPFLDEILIGLYAVIFTGLLATAIIDREGPSESTHKEFWISISIIGSLGGLLTYWGFFGRYTEGFYGFQPFIVIGGAGLTAVALVLLLLELKSLLILAFRATQSLPRRRP